MLRILSIPFSIVAYVLVMLCLLVFHVIQVVSLRLFGYEAHKKSIDYFNISMLSILYVLFTTTKAEFESEIPTGKPLILAANHQGIFDIMSIGWYMRRYYPKYVSKIELGKNIPSVSFSLRNGGSVLIDRKNPRQALPALKKMGEYIQEHKCSVLIFPEGTRSRNGEPKPFSSSGLKILCRYAPDALVVPITVNNSWKVFRYGGFPFGMGDKIKLTIHEPIAVADYDFDTLFEMTEKRVVESISNS